MTSTIMIRNVETRKHEVWTIKEVLEEINRDRSPDWKDYDESDWKEGWKEWVEGEFYSMYL